jgi:hypothetical protein
VCPFRGRAQQAGPSPCTVRSLCVLPPLRYSSTYVCENPVSVPLVVARCMQALELVKKLEQQGVKIPKAIANVALHFVRGSVKKRAKFDIYDVKPIAHAHEAFIPAFFIVAEVGTRACAWRLHPPIGTSRDLLSVRLPVYARVCRLCGCCV